MIKAKKTGIFGAFKKDITKNYQLYLVVLCPVIYLIVFKYIPMYGIQLAFKKFVASDGVWNSPWVGFDYFAKLFKSPQFTRILFNTLGLSFYQLAAGFPMPIILALMLNSTNSKRFKKTVQMVTYMPHFISIVVLAGMILQFANPKMGIVAQFVKLLGGTPVDIMGKPAMFKSIYVWTGIWQTTGWSAIIYLAALASVPPSLHEAAMIDGASKLKRTIYIDIPGIMPTAVILLIMKAGRIMNVGFEKVFLLQNKLNLRSSEIISTYVYKVGLASLAPDFSYATAIGLFNSVINLILIVSMNQIARKLGDTSLW